MTDNDTDTKPLHGPNLILDVENFGPIAEAKNIEFRPMTVFVGPSNTGKSYLAMLLHAMLQGMNVFRRDHTRMMNPFFASKLSEKERKAMATESAQLSLNPGRFTVGEGRMLVGVNQYSKPVSAMLNKIAKFMHIELTRSCISSIEDFYESEIAKLANVANVFQSIPSIELADVHRRLIINANLDRIEFQGTDGTLEIDARFHRLYTPENDDDEFVEAIAVSMTQSLLRMVMESWSTVVGSIYFPAARTGILQSHQLMTDSLIANAHRVGIDSPTSIAYHKVARDFLRLINSAPRDRFERRLRDTDSARATLDAVAARLEESVIDGVIDVRESQWGPPDFGYRPNGSGTVRLPMFRSSSMVTEVAPIIHFLRNHVRPGDLLIIEEPEAHLHPAAQQKMAAVLAYMVRVGLRVLVTTHSHYIVEQMGALVNAGAASVDPEERARRLGLLGPENDRDLFLRQSEVAVYEFEPQDEIGSPSGVTELEFDPEAYAYYPGGYSAALADQHNRNMHMVGARLGF